MSAASYRQLRIGQYLVGLVGLDELFARLRDAGRPAGTDLVLELLAGACQVGCSACAAVCSREAITFPAPAVLEALGQRR